MRLNTFFKRIVCLNKLEDCANWTRTLKNLKKMGVSAERVDITPYLGIIPPFCSLPGKEISLLLTFYSVIKRAQIDRIDNVLILSDRIKCIKSGLDTVERLAISTTLEWDLLYLGYDSVQFKIVDENKVFAPVFGADGEFALGVNNTFYNIFLEEVKAPVYSLGAYLKHASLHCDVFVSNPPVFKQYAK